MNLLHEFMSGHIALNLRDSKQEDIDELSDGIEEFYPELPQKTITIYYRSIKDFQHQTNCELCFYSDYYTTWDGYKCLDTMRFEKDKIYTAHEILNDMGSVQEINETDLMQMFE